MGQRLVGNDKVKPEVRPALRKLKAVRQGIGLRPAKSWWPALSGLSAQTEAEVRAFVRDWFVWEASLPRVSIDGHRIS